MPSRLLVLPLPEAYGESIGDGFYRHHDASGDTQIPPAVERYLDDLCCFLARAKLIQRHPDDFFDSIGTYSKTNPQHLDGTKVTMEERDYTISLCQSFESYFHTDGEGTHLSEVISSGPPSNFQPLYSFFLQTKQLQLQRRKRPNDDSVSVALGHDQCRSACSTDTLVKKEEIMNMVLSQGMSVKKKHEVKIMCKSVEDLVRCCNEESETCKVDTVINIGEGKGYVSRALSLVSGLQVIGLDCNPSHKEKVVERFESLVEASCNTSRLFKKTPDEEKNTPINLFYEPRGYMTSIACTVTETINWARILEGYANILDTSGNRIPAVDVLDEVYTDDVSLEQQCAADTKMRCRCCERTFRRSVMSLSRHAFLHVDEGSEEILSKSHFDELNRTLPPSVFTKKLIEIFFVPITGQAAHKKTLPPPWEICFVPRGYRARVALSGVVLNSLIHPKCLSRTSNYAEIMGTVLGFDEASNLHQVVLEGEQCRHRLTLAKLPPATRENAEDISKAYKHCENLALGEVLSVETPLPSVKPFIQVPSLRNTIMMGLHTCGDLGSNICRIFSMSESRGLLLVSCCWHALTPSGFPISNAFKCRGLSTEKLSLLLATQPYDMWSSVDSNGHRGSTKLLFYRSALKLIWRIWEEKWKASIQSKTELCCEFAPLPHLEPGFLRRVAKNKNEIVFFDFLSEVLKHYIFDKTAQKTAYTWDNSVCTACRQVQEQFFASELNRKGVNEWESNLSSTYFPSFLAVIVLRMWMCHIVETVLLLDRTMFLYEAALTDSAGRHSAVSLFPLFDGRLSPRLYGICVKRS